MFAALPPAIHEGALRAYVDGASHLGLDARQTQLLIDPWLGSVGQAAFYRQIAQADQAYTDEVQPLYGAMDLPVLVLMGYTRFVDPGGTRPSTDRRDPRRAPGTGSRRRTSRPDGRTRRVGHVSAPLAHRAEPLTQSVG